MTDRQNYKQIIESIFGVHTESFNPGSSLTNNVIGALNNGDYKKFSNAFTERLKRLNQIYSAQDKDRKNLLVQVNAIATNTWEGAYSELVAFDFLNRDKKYTPDPISLNKDIDPNRTFAVELGQTGSANLDGWFSEYDVYFDVKSLKDNVREMLLGICNEIRKQLKRDDIAIIPDYPLTLSYRNIQDKRDLLLKEFETKIDQVKKTPFIQSQVINNLKYRIVWGKGIAVTMQVHNMHQLAEQYHRIVFLHAKKFVKGRPFFLVFVVFPWFNGIITDFLDSNKKFYRAFARRVFCQYISTKTLFKELCPNFSGNQTIFDLTKKLSGLIFLEDKCIEERENESENVSSFIYLNPNADNKITASVFAEYIRRLTRSDFDDFIYDNY
ncbi:MAG: hypothetical protein QME58_05540 [Bacteroidota bacterium]|nr:hypothetical protein [Bacteroidota bacterium]